MAGVRKLPSGRYQGWFMDWTGKQRFFTHNMSPKETERIATSFEDHHRRIRLGDLPAPKSSDIPRPFTEVAEEYLEWGKSQGGHSGRSWSPVHVALRTRHLTEYWPDNLHPTTLTDVTLPKVESLARKLAKTRTGKTVQLHVESIKALLLWAKQRGYIETNPLDGMAPFDTTAKNPRGALTEAQLSRLLEVAPAERRILYEVAVCTGYRKGEMAALKVRDLDEVTNTLPLAAAFTKGRRDARQPIPAALVQRLQAVSQGKPDNDPLLIVEFHVDRLFHRDRKNADIPERDNEGNKLVFHSLRHTYCTLLIESGASLTEAQRLMRHTDPKLTANIYSHARKDRLHEVAETIGGKVLQNPQKYAPSMHAPAPENVSLGCQNNSNKTITGSNPFTRFESPRKRGP